MPVTINYPASLDAFPEPDETTYRDDPGLELDVLVAKALKAAEELEAKLGIGATTPDTLHKTQKATAAGTTAWGYHSLVKIAEASGTGSSGVLTFSSIPATFRELQLVVTGRMTGSAVTSTGLRLGINGNTTAADYDYQILAGNAAAASAAEVFGTAAYIDCGIMPGASSTTNLHSSARIWLPEYANTGIWKSVQAVGAGTSHIASASFVTTVVGAVFESLAAISSLTLTLAAGNWTTTSRATLYGVPAD